MKKIWIVARATYRQRIRAGTFLILTFGLPVLMLIAGAIPFFVNDREGTLPPVGIVDETEHLVVMDQVPVDDGILDLTIYADRDAAQSALQNGEIGAYLVVPAGYLAGESPRLYIEEEPSARVESALALFLRRAVAPDAPDWLLARLADPVSVTYVDSARGVAISSGPGLVVRILTPIVLAMLFGLMVLTGASQMGSAMVREKDQRAMEMVITSLAPRQLVAGKVLGMTLLSLTQIGVWLLGGVLAVSLALAGALDPESISIPWRAVAWAILLGIPAYFLYAVLAAGLGIVAGDSQQAQQLAGILGFLGLAPLWLTGAIVGDPDGTLALALTLFPLTSPIVSLLRMALTTVPLWQLSAALVLIVVSLVASIWFVARIFRAAMLLYGQALRPRAIWQALRTA